MLAPLAVFVAGLVALIAGGNALVHGASSLARRLGLSPLVIGLTVVAWGTSAPELAVSLPAALRGQADIALGNVVGSNIVNLLGVIGASALAAPLFVSDRLVRLDVPILIGLSFATYLMAFDGRIGTVDGALLALAGVAYTVFAIRTSRADPQSAATRPPATRAAVAASLGFVMAGLALLALGGHWMVESATVMARAFGVSELVIGLTIVAVGTSLPEAAASVIAAWRGERDIAVGNAVGSNIFNLVTVLGLTALASGGRVAVAPAALAFDLPVMVAVALACLPIFFTGQRVERWEGALLLAYYAAYTAYLALASGSHDELPLLSRTMVLFVIPITVLMLTVAVLRERRERRQRGSPLEGAGSRL
jgi:cation:H+ antiporter